MYMEYDLLLVVDQRRGTRHH